MLQVGQGVLDLLPLALVHVLAADGEGVLATQNELLRLVAHLLVCLVLLILRGVLGGVRHGLLNFALRQVGAGGDDDLLGASGAQVPGRDF